MKAITYRVFGAARDVLQIEDLESPTPGPGEVLIDVAFSGVNPSDVKARAGARPGVTKPPYPVIVPHSDGSGIISAVGEGVLEGRIGERVWIWNGQWQRPFGTAAEQIALPSEQAVRLPDSASLETGAVLGIPGLTACHTVFSGGDIAGQTVLVQGGAGTVGYLAVQLAKWGGARVIATAGSGSLNRARSAGADATLDYATPDLAEQILDANSGQPVHRIVEVEFGRNAETDAAVIAENGRINTYGSAKAMTPPLPFYPLMFKSVTLEMVLIYLQSPEIRARTIAQLARALKEGALDCPIQSVHDLTNAAAAHEEVEAGGRTGAVLIRTDS
ncbi:MAG: NADPH:quinone reductase [Ruegeria sp.]|uniref:NADPH:quinone reductase n=1 Tax=Ruegeria sp. TaxID=1879320 RepID=UPI00349E6972